MSLYTLTRRWRSHEEYFFSPIVRSAQTINLNYENILTDLNTYLGRLFRFVLTVFLRNLTFFSLSPLVDNISSKKKKNHFSAAKYDGGKGNKNHTRNDNELKNYKETFHCCAPTKCNTRLDFQHIPAKP